MVVVSDQAAFLMRNRQWLKHSRHIGLTLTNTVSWKSTICLDWRCVWTCFNDTKKHAHGKMFDIPPTVTAKIMINFTALTSDIAVVVQQIRPNTCDNDNTL